MTILPWLVNEWHKLKEAYLQNRVPHALLWIGQDGLGKKHLAEMFARLLLCQEGTACGQCHPCHLMHAKSHPDFVDVSPEDEMIKIEQIRQIVHFVQQTPMLGRFRVIIINPSSAMNLYAANALLKTLEEPTPNTVLILINNLNLRMPATILSRCQKIIFQTPARDVALNWLHQQTSLSPTSFSEGLELVLNLSEGAPIKALQAITSDFMMFRQTFFEGLIALSEGRADPLTLAAEWQEKELKLLLYLLISWLRDLIRSKFAIAPINHDYSDIFKKTTLSCPALFEFYDKIQERLAKVTDLQNLNRQLLLEELLIHWRNCYEPR